MILAISHKYLIIILLSHNDNLKMTLSTKSYEFDDNIWCIFDYSFRLLVAAAATPTIRRKNNMEVKKFSQNGSLRCRISWVNNLFCKEKNPLYFYFLSLVKYFSSSSFQRTNGLDGYSTWLKKSASSFTSIRVEIAAYARVNKHWNCQLFNCKESSRIF